MLFSRLVLGCVGSGHFTLLPCAMWRIDGGSSRAALDRIWRAIRDFCPHRVRAASNITQRSTLPADRDIESMLPYHVVSLVGNEGKLVYDAIDHRQ